MVHWYCHMCQNFLSLFIIILKNTYLFASGLSCSMRDLVPWPGNEPGSPSLGAWSLSHWTTREVPFLSLQDWIIFHCMHLAPPGLIRSIHAADYRLTTKLCLVYGATWWSVRGIPCPNVSWPLKQCSCSVFVALIVPFACVHACSVVSDSLRLHHCSPPGSSVHETSQTRIPEWIAISFSSVGYF